MKVKDAIQELGIDADNVPGELILVQFVKKGGKTVAKHFRLDEVADAEITVDLYLATGTFAPGKVEKYEGRSQENVVSVLWLVLDCDLKDYLGVPKEQLYEWSDGDLMTAARALAGDLRELLEAIGVTVHRIDYTGYGICAYIYLNGHTTEDVPEIAALNAGLVDQVNSMWGSTLADKGVHDAGPRVTRLVPGPNTKGSTPRAAQTIYRVDGHTPLADLSRVIQKRTRTTVGRAIPRTGTDLPGSVMHDLIDAVLPHWVEGNRHGLALALAGILAKAGVSEDQAARVVEFAANAAGDMELADRMKAVETSYQRARAGLQTRGLYGLRDWLPIETVEFIDRLLEDVRGRVADVTFTVAEGVVDDNTGSVDSFEVLDIPESSKAGLVGEYIALLKPTTESSEGFHLGVFLTIAGAMIGRRIAAEYGGNLYPNLYTLLVGTSGHSRKDTAIKKGVTFLNTRVHQGTTIRQSGVALLTDVSSGEGTIKALSEKPNTLMYISEFSRLMVNTTRKGTAIIPVLIEAFDTPAVMSNSSLSNPLRAEYPYASILAATQPRILEGLMSDEHVHSGFINRWLIIPGKSDNPLPIPPKADLQALNLLFEQVHTAINDVNDGTALSFSKDGEEFWTHWYIENWHKKRPEDAAAMSVRHPVLAVKIALIYAVLNGEQFLTAEHLQRAVAIIDWMWRHVERMLPGWGGTLQGRIEAKVLQFLGDRGPTKRRLLTQYCRSRTWGTADFNQALDALVKGGLIHIDANGIVGLRNDE